MSRVRLLFCSLALVGATFAHAGAPDLRAEAGTLGPLASRDVGQGRTFYGFPYGKARAALALRRYVDNAAVVRLCRLISAVAPYFTSDRLKPYRGRHCAVIASALAQAAIIGLAVIPVTEQGMQLLTQMVPEHLRGNCLGDLEKFFAGPGMEKNYELLALVSALASPLVSIHMRRHIITQLASWKKRSAALYASAKRMYCWIFTDAYGYWDECWQDPRGSRYAATLSAAAQGAAAGLAVIPVATQSVWLLNRMVPEHDMANHLMNVEKFLVGAGREKFYGLLVLAGASTFVYKQWRQWYQDYQDYLRIPVVADECQLRSDVGLQPPSLALNAVCREAFGLIQKHLPTVRPSLEAYTQQGAEPYFKMPTIFGAHYLVLLRSAAGMYLPGICELWVDEGDEVEDISFGSKRVTALHEMVHHWQNMHGRLMFLRAFDREQEADIYALFLADCYQCLQEKRRNSSEDSRERVARHGYASVAQIKDAEQRFRLTGRLCEHHRRQHLEDILARSGAA